MTGEKVKSLLEQGPVAVNLGVRDFAETLVAQQVPVVHVDWSPPPELDTDLEALLEELG